ncbi:hypothetical protein PIB30_026069 [Stylosanthes scabra]|uniref:Uncharacterized protein n=1 Tax=Stylosanthes scabra TaxID=79078 RepID=A0ABU6YCE6_9FABA|nr:hypothetical protein [Stylosanthes scabra]
MPQSTISEFSAYNLTVMSIMITHHNHVKNIRVKLPPNILVLQLQQLIILVHPRRSLEIRATLKILVEAEVFPHRPSTLIFEELIHQSSDGRTLLTSALEQ